MATTTAGHPVPGRRGAATRQALVRATAELVAEVGYHHATTRAIAERAGVAEGSIYRHFPDKRALFSAAVIDSQQGLTEWMTDLPARAGTAPLEDVLTEALTQLSRLRAAIIPLEAALAATPELAEDPSGAAGPGRHVSVVGPNPAMTNAQLSAALEHHGGPPLMVARYLAAEQDLGHVRADLDPAHTAIVVLATLYGVQTSPLAGTDGLDESGIRAVVTLLIRGIGT